MQLTRVAASATTIAVLALATAGPALAAPTAGELYYSSSTSTGVVQVVLTLPTALPALPGVPNPIELTLIGTDAAAFHGKDGQPDVAAANSYLAGGSLVLESPLTPLLAPLNRTVSRDLAHPGTASAAALAAPANPLGLALTLAGQTATVNKTSKSASSAGSLAEASLGSLNSLGLDAVLDPALAQLNAVLAELVTAATPLTDGLASVPALPVVVVPNPLAPVVGGPATITSPALSGATLSATVNELPARVAALLDTLLNGAAVKLSAVSTSESITPAATSVLANGSTKLGSVELFGGLVTVKASEAKVSALASTTKSAAKSDASATLIEVTISTAFGTLLQAIASDKGLTAGLLDGSLGQVLSPTAEPVVQAVDDALNTILAELTGLLETLNSGASLIQQGTTSKKISADGRTVEAHAVPAQVRLGVPGAADLVTLSVGKADAVSALSVAAAPVVVVPPNEQLPRTGGSQSAALLALSLLAIGGVTLALRRRATA